MRAPKISYLTDLQLNQYISSPWISPLGLGQIARGMAPSPKETNLFSDRSWFCLQSNDGPGLVYRRHGERFVDHCVLQKDKVRGGSVTVWDRISYAATSNLVIVNGNLAGLRYRDTTITLHDANGPGMILQKNSAHPHVVIVVQDHFQQQQTDVLPWLGVSLDLSPTEHV